jgi:hypothetical protein
MSCDKMKSTGKIDQKSIVDEMDDKASFILVHSPEHSRNVMELEIRKFIYLGVFDANNNHFYS